MRQIFVMAVTVGLFTTVTRADEAAVADKPLIPWQTPFETISASQSAKALIFVLITNEDPFHFSESRGVKQGKRANPVIAKSWCSDLLLDACRKAITERADLEGRIRLQSIIAGLPSEITGGVPRNQPRRAIVALCDGKYRVLAISVGVPDKKEIQTMIEDGEEVASTRQLNTSEPEKVLSVIAQRSSGRLGRYWREALSEILEAMEGDRDDPPGAAQQTAQSIRRQIQQPTEMLDPVYVSDIRLRFGLTDASDRDRLVVLEQHPETRRSWCDAMIPFIASTDFSAHWKDLAESLWGQPAIDPQADISELLSWYDNHIETEAVVLSLAPPPSLRHLPWPPITDRTLRRGIGWQKAHALALEHPFRVVDAQQLALLLRARNLNAVDLYRPSLARYLFLEPKKSAPGIVREQDPPGRFAGRLKRTKSSLQTN